MNPIVHGKASSYTTRGCRCQECRMAWNSYTRKTRKEFSSRERNVTHGTESTYTYGCRCDECRMAHNVNQKRLYAIRKVIPDGKK